MSDDVILKVENISKQYRLGTVGTGTINHDFNRFLAKIRGKEDPYLKIGETNNRASKGASEYVWALKDINFEVKRGEVLGIIGKNGAGKSTLLKILSKVTGPTTGSIKSKGRIASLLEVGTGFHPEMTGKENVFLNGAILGMTKKEIASKLDEIVTFSGCERYIDTPVKRYSSGMKVRLAFAVAAHLEPDILVIDEVLAVGDAEFQKKAIGKMQDISGKDGRTVLFVSHNMAAVENLCTRSILLVNGNVVLEGKTEEVIEFYLKNEKKQILQNILGSFNLDIKKEKKFGIQNIELYCNGDKTSIIKSGSVFKIKASVISHIRLFGPEFGIGIYNDREDSLMRFNNIHIGQTLNINEGESEITLTIENFPIYKNGVYFFNLYFGDASGDYEILENVFSIEVLSTDVFNSGRPLEVKYNQIVHKNIKFKQ
ncbi:ABC transporter ATP-binding protein [Polaribacter sp. PL03]|uniref:ABC transporter ATP-binding protein n=1 Tax=Polaribacter sp. PL03 TaxID=3088353 RepID=UPI0029CD2794|nr:ABC transporter ATP-binding protein [Polaribacter sp. PL03]MDX6746077.1 ABC transporter ATP-binding protein [Polaribacter sp. PL03]